jgi:hypothetical protein
MTNKWAITLRRTEISEHTLDLVVEAPTLEAALKAAPKVVVDDLGWELDDFRWADGPPTVDSHGTAPKDDVPDVFADGEGNLVEVPVFRPPGARIARHDD